MLSRFARVTPEGEYVPPAVSEAKMGYLTMVHVRAGLVKSAGRSLARALTIAVRYSAVRQQGGEPGAETAVLDYTSQQAVLLPLVSSAFAMHFAGQCMITEYETLVAGVSSGQLQRLPWVHAQLAGLKALTTYIVADGMEAARRACGGHGYLVSSGLPVLIGDYTAMCTLEGTRDVLEQQAARYFLKQSRAHPAEAPPTPLNASTLLDLSSLEAAFTARAAIITCQTASLLDETQRCNTASHAWNAILVEAARVSRSHCHATLLSAFRAAAETAGSLAEVLTTLCRLFAITTLLEHLGDFLAFGLLLPADVPAARAHARTLLARLRPDAVSLVESWDFSDHYLNSTIGSSDGRVYERLMEATRDEPLNSTPVRDRYETVLSPMLRGKL